MGGKIFFNLSSHLLDFNFQHVCVSLFGGSKSHRGCFAQAESNRLSLSLIV